MLTTLIHDPELGAAENWSLIELMAILHEQPFDLVTPDICDRESILTSFRMDPRYPPPGMTEESVILSHGRRICAQGDEATAPRDPSVASG